ncbi:MAG: methionyl-tRNA formyltransferase [Gemmataceae bacterium]|nr:methionyl-tRNA formyltransferase [Gemmataceae bacterium]
MMGTGVFAEPALETLLKSGIQVVGIFTQPDRESGEERGSTRQVGKGIKNIGLETGLGVFQPLNINVPQGVEALRGLNADLFVVAAYGQILSPDVLACARLGGINIHASLLPKYRGAAPVQRAIAAGEKETGVSILRMTPTLDGGEILASRATAIGAEETAGELEARLSVMGADLALEVVKKLQLGPLTGVVQDPAQATKAPKLKKEHGLICWDHPAGKIECHLRAMQPWPTAFTLFKRPGSPPLRLQIVKARVAPTSPGETGAPGALRQASPGQQGMMVFTGDANLLEVLELLPAGKKKMSGADFLRGKGWNSGDTLGPP